MDYSIRLPATPFRLKTLEEKATQKNPLPPIKDYLFKPQGVSLKDFSPQEVCTRLREFTQSEKPSTLVKITVKPTDTGYTDEKENLGTGETNELIKKAENTGNEKWGELATTSTLYELKLNGASSQVLVQKLSPVGTFLKIESTTQEGLNQALALLKAKESEKIEKNAAVLLAEHLKLI